MISVQTMAEVSAMALFLEQASIHSSPSCSQALIFFSQHIFISSMQVLV